MFNIRNLSVLAYAQGFTQWLYKDTGIQVCDAKSFNFFDNAKDMITVGDMIVLSCRDGGSVVFVTTADTYGVTVSAAL